MFYVKSPHFQTSRFLKITKSNVLKSKTYIKGLVSYKQKQYIINNFKLLVIISLEESNCGVVYVIKWFHPSTTHLYLTCYTPWGLCLLDSACQRCVESLMKVKYFVDQYFCIIILKNLYPISRLHSKTRTLISHHFEY